MVFRKCRWKWRQKVPDVLTISPLACDEKVQENRNQNLNSKEIINQTSVLLEQIKAGK